MVTTVWIIRCALLYSSLYFWAIGVWNTDCEQFAAGMIGAGISVYIIRGKSDD